MSGSTTGCFAMTLCLGIESSCDDAGVAIVRDGREVLAERVASQADDFAAWGGVVPELAARGHVAAFPGIIADCFEDAGCGPRDLDCVAVAAYPGLIGSLLCGVTAGKVIAARGGCGLVAVDHIQAHLAAAHLAGEEIRYPALGLVASGGHSHYYLCSGPGAVQLLGGTIDDAAGEAFDKAAAMLELGYPGGPLIERYARTGDPRAIRLPRSFRSDDTLRLSFAGLKTSLLYRVRGPQGRNPLQLDAQGLADACASFQQAVVDVLVDKLVLAGRQHAIESVIIGGGVACNGSLRNAVAGVCQEHGWDCRLPLARHCADNGAMIAALGCFQYEAGDCAAGDLAPLPTGARGPRRST